MNHDLPTHVEIAKIPDLATISVLQFALDVAVRTVVAAHPELEPEPLAPKARARVQCAKQVLGEIRMLAALLDSYRYLSEDWLRAEVESGW